MKITLSDIARKAGVTASTVQRALSGRAGVSGAKREEIRRIALDMGYMRGSYLTSLSRDSTANIVALLPDSASLNRYYARSLWMGVEQYMEKHSGLSIHLERMTYERSPDDHAGSLLALLDRKERIDGIVTRGALFPSVVNALAELERRDIPVVLVGADIAPRHRICCVRNHEVVAGRMAADVVLQSMGPEHRRIALVCGSFSILNQFHNAEGFKRQIWEYGSPIEIVKVMTKAEVEELVNVKRTIRELLANGLDVHAMYSCNARMTLAMCEAMEEFGLSDKVCAVGSDIYPESANLLRAGKLNAIIHNKPATLAYTAMQIMADYLLKGEHPSQDTVIIDSVIVMRSNLDYYMGSAEPMDDTQIKELAAGTNDILL